MAAGLVAMRAVDCLLRLFDGLIVELHDRPAAHADEMVVVRVPVGVLEAPRPLVRTGSTGKPRVGKEFDGAEDRRMADSRVDAARSREELLGGNVALESKESVEHRLAGSCHILPALAEIRFENLSLLTAHRLPRSISF